MVNARSQIVSLQLKKGFKVSQAINFPKWPRGWFPCSFFPTPLRV